MSAGDLVTVDYHLELRGLLMGPGTRYSWGPEGWGGFGPVVKSQDVDLDQADGAYAGRDYLAAKALTFPIVTGGAGPADVMLDHLDLAGVWGPSVVDVELHGQLPGWGRFFVVGRPRGFADDLTNLKSGEGRVLATFFASDPRIYFPDAPGS